jgi:hypothetical protein
MNLPYLRERLVVCILQSSFATEPRRNQLVNSEDSTWLLLAMTSSPSRSDQYSTIFLL